MRRSGRSTASARRSVAGAPVIPPASNLVVRTYLPWNTPPRSELTASPRKVFAHYFLTFPLAASENRDTRKNGDGSPVDPLEYWHQNWEVGAPSPVEGATDHSVYGGLVRDHPLVRRAPRTSIPSPTKPGLTLTWQIQDKMVEVREAIAAELDGFTLDLLQVRQSPTDAPQRWVQALELFEAVGEVKRQDGVDFWIACMPDGSTSGTTNANTLADALKYLLDTYPTIVYKHEGYFWLGPYQPEVAPAYRNSVPGTDPVSPRQFWDAVLLRLRTTHGIPTVFWPCYSREWLDAPQHPALAAISYGASRWGDRDPVSSKAETTSNRRAYYHLRKTFNPSTKWMQSASPGDERPNGGRYWERDHWEQWRESWLTAIGDNTLDAAGVPLHPTADLVQVPTWSDYAEGAQIAPSENFGTTQCDLGTYYLIRYKTGQWPTIVRDAVYLSHRIQPQTGATYTGGQTKFMTRAGNTTVGDTVGVECFFVTGGVTVTVNVGGTTATFNNVGAGRTALRTPLLPGGSVGTGLVSVTATRGGSIIASVASSTKRQVKTTLVSQDMSYRAASSLR